jgi:hypothetical protein
VKRHTTGTDSVFPQKEVDPSGKTLAEWHHRKVWFSPRGVIGDGHFVMVKFDGFRFAQPILRADDYLSSVRKTIKGR